MFVDIARIKIKAGDGGNGAVAFHREKYVAAGGPDGGDGGRGGDIVFVVDESLSTLSDFRYKRKYTAENGKPGGSGRKNGKSGLDLIIRVPKGTIIKEVESDTVIADMGATDRFVGARGGKGGWGNTHFKSPTRQIPRFAKDGIPGEEWEITLELKLLADVGLIGFPNVGKSTLISVVSKAKPLIGNYHFTTLTPVLGVVSMGASDSFVIADIPGLIEGASEGVGLGHEFLRHVERCRMLIHVVDVSGSEGRDPIEDFKRINEELFKFNPELTKLPQIVAGNKIDIATDEQLCEFKNFVEKQGLMYFPIIAPIAEGTNELINATATMLYNLPPIKRFQASEVPLDFLVSKKPDRSFEITVNDGVFFVEAPWLVKIMSKIDYEDYESLQYFQRVLESSGINDALEQKGINQGDTVSIYDMEFDYIP